MQYTFCGRQGHIVDKCYKNHGFSPNFKYKDKLGPGVNHMIAIGEQDRIGSNTDYALNCSSEATNTASTFTME